MTGAEDQVGLLTVRMPELEADVRPSINVVDAQSLQLIKTAVADEQLEIPAGQYVLSSTLPSGERTFGITEVSPGEHQEVALSPAQRGTVPAHAPTIEDLKPSDEPGDGRAVVAPAAGVSPFFLRYLNLRREGVEVGSGGIRVVDIRGPNVELQLTPYGVDGVVFIQLALPGEVPLNIALPANGMTGSQDCSLTTTVKPRLIGAISLPNNPRVDAVARYLNNGDLQEAANVAVDAEELLRRKMADPFGAALGGFVLLRLNELTRLHNWADNLAQWFPWLPDGPIIAGEAAALTGDHQRAVANFCEAARRGLPVFADGFSMLVSRLREYDRAQQLPGTAADLRAEVSAHAMRLMPLSPLVNFTRISLAIHGARLDDLLGSQKSANPELGADGWRRFAPDPARIEE
jgi:hypothetical protein